MLLKLSEACSLSRQSVVTFKGMSWPCSCARSVGRQGPPWTCTAVQPAAVKASVMKGACHASSR